MSFAATLALYELAVRRFRITRLLTGMKPHQATVTKRPHNGLAEAAGSYVTATGPDTGTAG